MENIELGIAPIIVLVIYLAVMIGIGLLLAFDVSSQWAAVAASVLCFIVVVTAPKESLPSA